MVYAHLYGLRAHAHASHRSRARPLEDPSTRVQLEAAPLSVEGGFLGSSAPLPAISLTAKVVVGFRKNSEGHDGATGGFSVSGTATIGDDIPRDDGTQARCSRGVRRPRTLCVVHTRAFAGGWKRPDVVARAD